MDSLFEHLRRGYTIEYFLAQFPTVARAHAEFVLEMASLALVSEARRTAG